jgi:predicted enzyme related to lactoylglutathione lyase
MAKLNYVELPAQDVAVTKAFFTAAFGWSFADYGPTYAATQSGETDLGLQGDRAEWPSAPLPVIEVCDLEASEAAVTAAGGTVTQPIFSFPGGRRFHFRDPNGNELAVMQPAAH